jgi:hypothetical protein
MKSRQSIGTLLPPGLLDELEAAADEEHREPGELMREAVMRYLEERRTRRCMAAKANMHHTPAEAATRILKLRKGNILPAGVTISDLIDFGRA